VRVRRAETCLRKESLCLPSMSRMVWLQSLSQVHMLCDELIQSRLLHQESLLKPSRPIQMIFVVVLQSDELTVDQWITLSE
jgi:hypothetical protein